MPILHKVFSLAAQFAPMDAYCAGYELRRWRGTELARDVFNRHLASFALNYSETRIISSDTALESLGRAAQSVYETDKYQKRGEFGELLLHGILVDFYNTEPVVSKIYFEDTPNHTVKGFDSVHLTVSPTGEFDLWLGEAKFYSSLTDAIDELCRDVSSHLTADFLRREFTLIGRKVDPNWPHAATFLAATAAQVTLDNIVASIRMPLFFTYESDAVQTNYVSTQTYWDELEEELNEAINRFNNKITVPMPVSFHIIALPILSKADLIDQFHNRLIALQAATN